MGVESTREQDWVMVHIRKYDRMEWVICCDTDIVHPLL